MIFYVFDKNYFEKKENHFLDNIIEKYHIKKIYIHTQSKQHITRYNNKFWLKFFRHFLSLFRIFIRSSYVNIFYKDSWFYSNLQSSRLSFKITNDVIIKGKGIEKRGRKPLKKS